MTTRLSEVALLAAAGDVVFGRGRSYRRKVENLSVHGGRATATVVSTREYSVTLAWSAPSLDGTCTCPHFAQGWFCKHLVAVGLAMITEQEDRQPALAPEPPLIELTADEVREAARDALRGRGYVDYRRARKAAAAAQLMLDDLEGLLDSGHPDLAQPALRYSVTRLRATILNSDDSDGVLGDACQRATELYARACREGTIDQVKLGRWLVKFRADSPGWPDLTLDDFSEALGAKGLAAYRKQVLALNASTPRSDDEYGRFELDSMLLELADHDGDVDGAIAILSPPGRTRFGAILSRLEEAGRHDEALAWIDRAVTDGRVSSHGPVGNGYWLTPEHVADTYIAAGRLDEALDVLRTSVMNDRGYASFARLLAYADRLGRRESERQTALAALRQQAATDPHLQGAVLVEIALSESDHNAAWLAAEEFGAGYSWRQLAAAASSTHPSRCAELYRSEVEKELRFPNSPAYPQIAATLATIGRLSVAAGEDAEFADYMAGIRATNARRPALMAALDRAGLP